MPKVVKKYCEKAKITWSYLPLSPL